MNKLILFVAAVAAVGCKRAESSGSRMPSPEGGIAELAWAVEGREVRLVAHEEQGQVVARAFFADKVRDLTPPVPTGDLRNAFELAGDGTAVVFKVESLAGREPESGALVDRMYALIEWNEASGEPTVQVWSCSDDEASGGICVGPPWTGMAAPEAVPAPEDPSRDPIEIGVDWRWAEQTEGCKEPLEPADHTFQQAYVALCIPAMARIRDCLGDRAFLRAVGDPPTGESGKRLLRDQLGTAAKAKAFCATMAREQLCNDQGRSYANPYGARDVRAIGEVAEGDCRTLARVVPGVVYASGE
jgi:hypothetical protein